MPKKKPKRTENRDQSTDPSRAQTKTETKSGLKSAQSQAKPTVKTASTAVCFFTAAYVLDWMMMECEYECDGVSLCMFDCIGICFMDPNRMESVYTLRPTPWEAYWAYEFAYTFVSSTVY